MIENLFGSKPTTVDGVMQVFTKTIDQLEQVRVDNETRVDQLNDQISQLGAQRNAAVAEKEKAVSTITKLRSLFG